MSKRHVCVRLAVAVCAGAAWGARAGEGGATAGAPAALPEMVISANRYETPASSVGSSVTVLDAADIAREAKPTVLEVLRGVPGVEVTQSGGPGRVASVSIRGGSSSQTLVLVDGVRVNSATLGAFDFANLPAENIARIEVLRGPQSTLYGSEAMGGVILITTRRGAAGQGGGARVEGGAPEQWLGTAEVHGGREGMDYSVSASLQQYKGLSAVDEDLGATEDDDFQNATASGRFGFAVGADGRADLTFRAFNGESDVDGYGVRPEDDPNATTEREGVAAAAALRQPVTDGWTQSLLVGLYDETLTGEDPDTEFNNYRVDNRNIDASAQADLTAVDYHVASVGYEFENRAGETQGSYDEDANINSVFLQDQWNPGQALYLTAGARLDDHSAFGSEPTWRGTASYGVPETAVRLHSSAGTGFKAPTFSDLYFPGSGNPALDPETSVGYDAGIEAGFGGGRGLIDVTWFHNAYDDLIAFDGVTLLMGNIREATAQGVEVSATLSLCTNAQVGATYTLTDTEDEATGEPLARRPKHRYTVQAAWQPVARINTVASLVAVSDRIESDGTDMDDYERVDLLAEYAFNARVYPYVRIENLLDQDYEEINGYSAPGFTGIGGLRAVW